MSDETKHSVCAAQVRNVKYVGPPPRSDMCFAPHVREFPPQLRAKFISRIKLERDDQALSLSDTGVYHMVTRIYAHVEVYEKSTDMCASLHGENPELAIKVNGIAMEGTSTTYGDRVEYEHFITITTADTLLEFELGNIRNEDERQVFHVPYGREEWFTVTIMLLTPFVK